MPKDKSRRLKQVSSSLAQIISEIIQKELADPRISAIVTITGVHISADLRSAVVYFSVLGDSDAWDSAEKGLGRASGYIQQILAKRIALRVTPKLRFVPDHTEEKAYRIERILDENISDENNR